MSRIAYAAATVLLATVFLGDLAQAYVGPGAGLSAIGSILSLLAAIGLGIVGFIWYPIRRLTRRLQSKKPKAGEAAE
jgi:hypothetical protein